MHYRLLELCSSDIGFQSAQSFDLEVWAPGSKEWLEVSSCSNCLDFQSRRANIKFYIQESKKYFIENESAIKFFKWDVISLRGPYWP